MYLRFIKSNLLLIVLFAWIILPVFAYNEPIRVLALISVVIFSLKYFSFLSKKLFFLIVFFVIYTFIFHKIESSPVYLLRHIQLYIFLALILISNIIVQFSNERKFFLILIILTFNLIALIGTFFGLLLDGHAARALSKSSEAGIILSKSGVGGYGTIYMNVLLYPLLLLIKKQLKNNLINYLVWSNIIALVLVILYANFLIAILLLFFQIIYLLIRSNKRNTGFGYIVFVIIMLLIAYSNIEYIENKTYFLVQNTSLRLKHQDIFNQIKGQETLNGTIYNRGERYTRSLNMFFTNPITGVLSFDSVGKHSNLLDLLAQFGLLIGFLFLFLLRELPLKLIKTNSIENKYYSKCFLWTIIIFSLVNNFAMQHGVLYIIMACLINNRDIDLNKIS